MDTINDKDQLELQQEDRIMTFLQGKMSYDEERSFLEELDKDKELKAKAVSIAHLAKGIMQVGQEKDKILNEALLSVDEETIRTIVKNAIDNSASTEKPAEVASKENRSRFVPFNWKYAAILSVAASVLFIVYLGFLSNDHSQTISLGEQYATPYETSVMRGNEQQEVTKELEKLINNVYSGTDLDATLKRLAVLWEVSTMDTYNDYTNYAPEIGWALATGYLKDNNKEDANEVLSKMLNLFGDDPVIAKRIKDLKERIDNL